MNRNRKRKSGIAAALAAFAVVVMLHGCGGGGGGSAPAPAAPQSPRLGNVTAAVTITGRQAGRANAAAGYATATLTVSISGFYSVDGSKFAPVSMTSTVDVSQGVATVTLPSVPIGVNHLLTAVTDYGGTSETVKVLIPEVTEGQTAAVSVNAITTIAADTAVYYAETNSGKLPDLDSSFLASVDNAVDSLVANGTAYTSMTPQQVLAYANVMNVPSRITVTPSPASVALGQTLQFTGTVLNADNIAVPGAAVTWSFSNAQAGSVNAAGLFTPAAAGTGIMTAASGSVSATASVTVISLCSTDASCNDGNPLTLDACTNPNSANAACTHSNIACATGADCSGGSPVCVHGGTASALCVACAANADCNDNNQLTADSCVNPGAANAVCSNVATPSLTPSVVDTLTIGAGSYTDLILSNDYSKLFAADTFNFGIESYNLTNQTDVFIPPPANTYVGRLTKDPSRNFGYALSLDANLMQYTVTKIDLSQDTMAATVSLTANTNYPGPENWQPEVSAARDELYYELTNDNTYMNYLSVINLSSFTEAASVQTNAYFSQTSAPVDDTTSTMYMGTAGNGPVMRFNLATRTALPDTTILPDPDMFMDLGLGHVNGASYLYAIRSATNVLEVYNLANNSLVCAVPGQVSSPRRAGKQLPGKAAGRQLKGILWGSLPYLVGEYEPLNHIYINNAANSTVDVYKASDCTLVASLPGAYPAWGFTFNPTLGRVYISHYDDTISVLQYGP